MATGNRKLYVLGIDIGTTTVKVALLDAQSRQLLQSLSRETKATLSGDVTRNEQDVHKICTALQFCVSRLSRDQMRHVGRIGISGQMHGVVLWRSGGGAAWKRNAFGRYETSDEHVSALYTWQDGRCTPHFLSSLPQPHSHLRLCTGQGCATLFWLARNEPEVLERYDCAATIQDFVVAMLCGLERPLMSVQNAASWGYFDTVSGTWNSDRLAQSQFPVHLLPRVLASGSTAGQLTSSWYDIEAGTSVGVALGDTQCSVFSTIESDNDAVFNISTSAQLSFPMPRGFVPDGNSSATTTTTIEYFPYFDERYLAVAASLNGGNCMAVFVRMLQQWTHELGLGVPEDKIWERVLATAQDDASATTDLRVTPTLFGERHVPEQRAAILNVDPHNISLGKVSRAICRGIIANIQQMMSRKQLLDAGIERIVGSGSALARNPVLRQELECQYAFPVVYGAGSSDAAVGVALATIIYGHDSHNS